MFWNTWKTTGKSGYSRWKNGICSGINGITPEKLELPAGNVGISLEYMENVDYLRLLWFNRFILVIGQEGGGGGE